ncbi:MAG: hypothetical protein PVH11_06315 [Anaerolineae bacterium]|jgi:hypothetical protein
MTYHLDPKTQEYLWRCPQCGASIRLASELAVSQVRRAGACQGCRAKAVLERNPALVGLYLDFWARADAWPQSDSWLEAIPVAGISILGGAHAPQGTSPTAGEAMIDRPTGWA